MVSRFDFREIKIMIKVNNESEKENYSFYSPKSSKYYRVFCKYFIQDTIPFNACRLYWVYFIFSLAIKTENSLAILRRESYKRLIHVNIKQ